MTAAKERRIPFPSGNVSGQLQVEKFIISLTPQPRATYVEFGLGTFLAGKKVLRLGSYETAAYVRISFITHTLSPMRAASNERRSKNRLVQDLGRMR